MFSILLIFYLYLCGYNNQIDYITKIQYFLLVAHSVYLVCHVLVVLGTKYRGCFMQVDVAENLLLILRC
jgi:hypothetical protein